MSALPEDQPVRPIYMGTRTMVGRRDLVVSFYTLKCQFKCRYCALPDRSSSVPVGPREIEAQIDHVLSSHADRLHQFTQFSCGNEGSVLDTARFPSRCMHHLLDRLHELPNLEIASFETRPEYVTEQGLADIVRRGSARTIDLTVGFETQDDHLRMVVLGKRITRRVLEERVWLLSAFDSRFTGYIMVKPAPRMTERQAVDEALATVEYLATLCERHGVPFLPYFTPTYIARTSELAMQSACGDYSPPTIQTIFEVVLRTHLQGLPVYTGLWSEGLAGEDGDFTARPGYDPALRAALVAFNRSNDPALLEPFRPILDV